MWEVQQRHLQYNFTIARVIWMDLVRGKEELRTNFCMLFFLCEPEHKSLEEMRSKIIDKTQISNPTKREGFWADQ